MHEHTSIESIGKGREVLDANGDSVGAVVAVLLPTHAAPMGGVAANPSEEACLQIDTGFLGLGKRLYIPVSAIRTVTDDRIFLTVEKSRMADMGWDEKPSWVDD